jgi:hypothetical protein
LRQGWGSNRRHGQKSQFQQHGGKRFGLKSKLQQSGNKRNQKVYFSMAGLGKKKKIVKKWSNISSNLVKINKKENDFFENKILFWKIGYDFENFVQFLKLGMILKIG